LSFCFEVTFPRLTHVSGSTRKREKAEFPQRPQAKNDQGYDENDGELWQRNQAHVTSTRNHPPRREGQLSAFILLTCGW